MIEINSTNNNSTNDDDEDAINTFSDDDSNEQYDLETDDSCEFDEEYSFDNVRRWHFPIVVDGYLYMIWNLIIMIKLIIIFLRRRRSERNEKN